MNLTFLLLPILYFAGNGYIFCRGGQLLGGLPVGAKIVLGVLYWCGALSFFYEFLVRGVNLSPTFDHLFSRLGSSWLVFTLYMTLSLAVCELVARMGHGHAAHAFLTALGFTLLTLGYGYYRYTHPLTRVVNKTIHKSSPTWTKPLKVVAVSDLHVGNGTTRSRLARYVDMINAEHPDVVWIGGDLIDNNVETVRRMKIEEELARIEAPMGVYMVLGNHEFFADADKATDYFRQTGVITLLRDSAVTLPNGLQLVGRDDRSNLRRQPVASLTASLDKSRPIALLDHQPYDLAEAAHAGADVQFSGHTHRGQVWPLNWLTDTIFELSYGVKDIDGCTFCVSSGLSLWGPPFRIGTVSEMVVFNIALD